MATAPDPKLAEAAQGVTAVFPNQVGADAAKVIRALAPSQLSAKTGD
ncbi:hypothetical protein [Acidocella sp.]|jgi:hypothetical protein